MRLHRGENFFQPPRGANIGGGIILTLVLRLPLKRVYRTVFGTKLIAHVDGRNILYGGEGHGDIASRGSKPPRMREYTKLRLHRGGCSLKGIGEPQVERHSGLTLPT